MGELRNKIISFAHKEFNQPYSLELKRPSKVVRRWEDLSERPGEPYDRVDDDPSISMEKCWTELAGVLQAYVCRIARHELIGDDGLRSLGIL